MDVGLLMLAGGFVAGLFGSLLGLGGGILIVPLLTIGFGLPVREAVGVSLVSVVMTSGASAAVFLQRDVANLRLGMFLELFTAAGAVIGGAVAFAIDQRYLAAMFAILMLYVAWTMIQGARRPAAAASPPTEIEPASHDAEASLGDDEPGTAGPSVDEPLGGTAATPAAMTAVTPPAMTAGSPVPPAEPTFVARLSRPGYRVGRVRLGSFISIFAGIISALLGVGGGIVKVPIMHLIMGVPLRVATATSNLMIGITASTSAIVYLLRGGIDPYVAGPTAVGVFLGATLGSRTAHRVDLRVLRLLFVAVLLYTAYEMTRLAIGLP